MKTRNITFFSRLLLAAIILLSGLALLPFSGLSAEKLTWELFAGIYQPELSVNDPSGAPGSTFLFTATGYPPNATATLFVNGLERGMLLTDGNGEAQFLVETSATDPPGLYIVTLSTDPNTAASQEISLVEGDPVIPPPANFSGPTFGLNPLQFWPAMFNQS